MDRVVVDTDVVSFYFKNDSRFASYAPELDGKQLVLSFMSLAELFLWHELRNWGNQRRERMLLEIQQRYILFPVDRELCKQWALLRAEAHSLGRVLESADAWIAATAMLLGVPLVTHNAKDFRFLPNLKIIAVPSH